MIRDAALVAVAAHLALLNGVVDTTQVPMYNPRPGSTDATIDAHDGPVRQWEEGGVYYRYAMSYTSCRLDGDVGTWTASFRWLLNRFVENAHDQSAGFDCGQIVVPALSDGFGRDCGFLSAANGQTVNIWSSHDLRSWTFVGDALAGTPSWLRDHSIIFRPAVIRHPRSGQYVLWVNRLPRDSPTTEAYRRAGFAVGVSSRPEGPFAFSEMEEDAMPTMTHAGGADFSLLQDGDDAYIAYGSWHNYRIRSGWKADWLPEWAREGHQIAVQRLDPTTFTRPDPTGPTAVTVTTRSQESPVFFRRGKFYYLITGDLCCFCQAGSDAKVMVSREGPLGPFVPAGQLNAFGEGHIRGQNSDVIEVQQRNGSKVYLWSADLWFSAASGMKGADHQYWEPLDFVDTMVEGLMDGGFNQHAIVPVPRRARAFRDCYELDIAILDSNRQVADEECRAHDDSEVDGGIGMGHGEL